MIGWETASIALIRLHPGLRVNRFPLHGNQPPAVAGGGQDNNRSARRSDTCPTHRSRCDRWQHGHRSRERAWAVGEDPDRMGRPDRRVRGVTTGRTGFEGEYCAMKRSDVERGAGWRLRLCVYSAVCQHDQDKSGNGAALRTSRPGRPAIRRDLTGFEVAPNRRGQYGDFPARHAATPCLRLVSDLTLRLPYVIYTAGNIPAMQGLCHQNWQWVRMEHRRLACRLPFRPVPCAVPEVVRRAGRGRPATCRASPRRASPLGRCDPFSIRWCNRWCNRRNGVPYLLCPATSWVA